MMIEGRTSPRTGGEELKRVRIYFSCGPVDVRRKRALSVYEANVPEGAFEIWVVPRVNGIPDARPCYS